MNKLGRYYRKIALKFSLVYFLNVTDFIFTMKLLETGLFREANPIMAPLMDNKLLVVTVKLVLVAVLCIYMIVRLKKANLKQLRLSNAIMSGAVGAYGIINLGHVFWSVRAF